MDIPKAGWHVDIPRADGRQIRRRSAVRPPTAGPVARTLTWAAATPTAAARAAAAADGAVAYVARPSIGRHVAFDAGLLPLAPGPGAAAALRVDVWPPGTAAPAAALALPPGTAPRGAYAVASSLASAGAGGWARAYATPAVPRPSG